MVNFFSKVFVPSKPIPADSSGLSEGSPPIQASKQETESLPAFGRTCCDEDTCIRKDIAHLLEPDSPIEDRIYTAASAVARTCGSLTPQELNLCASRLFDSPSECDLTKAFVIAYQTERDAIAGRRDIEKRRAAGMR